MKLAAKDKLVNLEDLKVVGDEVGALKSAKQDLIGTFAKLDLTTESYSYNIVDNRNATSSTYYHVVYNIPSGTKVLGVTGYHLTEKQALWGFYDSNDNLISYEQKYTAQTNVNTMEVVAVPENAVKIIVNIGSMTTRGVFAFTPLDVVGGIESAVHYDAAQTLTDTQKTQARENIGAMGANDVAEAVSTKQDIIGTFEKLTLTPEAYGYNIVENKNSSQSTFYHLTYVLPEGTEVVGINGYHATAKQALWGFYDSQDNLISYEEGPSTAVNHKEIERVNVPENAVKLIVNIGTYTDRGIHLFTPMDVSETIDNIDERTEALEQNAINTFPVVFPPSKPYAYDGEDITENYISGTGDMLTPYYALFDALVSAYPNNITSAVIGRDASNAYDIKAYTISQFTSTANKPVILWMSGIHASEPYTLTSTYALVRELLTNHDNDDVVGFIWRNCVLKVVPICNPWGLANGGSRFNSNGVNLNRDFPVDWEYSDDQYDKTGSAPASQAETQALMAFVNSNSNALFAVTKHDSNAYSDASGKIGYTVDNYKVDMNVLRGFYGQMHMQLHKKYSWIKTNRPSTAYLSLFNNLSTNDTHGSMNKWFNSIGVHGCLCEVTRPKSGDYTADKVQDFIQINLELSMNMLAAVLQQNGLLQSNNKVWNQYK